MFKKLLSLFRRCQAEFLTVGEMVDLIKTHPLDGKFIIACPNEWDSMVIGRVVGWLPNSDTIPIVDDLVTGEHRIVFSPHVEYSEEKLIELAKLNPYERYNALAKWSYVEMDKPKSGKEPMTIEDYAKVAIQVKELS